MPFSHMDESLKEQTLQRLSKANSISVVVSQSAESDGLASGLALFLSLKKLGKNVQIFAKSPTVGDAQTLYGVDQINKKGESGNLAIIIDNAVENIDKVTYSLEGDKLKIVVNALATSKGVSQNDVTFEKASGKADLIFAININSLDELKQEITQEENIDSNCWIIAINDLQSSQKFAQIEINNPHCASLSELTTQLFQDLALPLSEDIAYNLYAGIVNATASFSPSLARPSSFKAAEWLIKFGAGRASLAVFQKAPSRLPEEKPVNTQIEYKPVEDLTQKKQEAKSEQAIQPSTFDKPQDEWFKPPKIYKGSKSFDSES